MSTPNFRPRKNLTLTLSFVSCLRYWAFIFKEVNCVIDFTRNLVQARSQHFYKGGTKNEDGRTEGPERGVEARRAGAPRGWSLGRGAPPENFRKINVEIAHFHLDLPARYHSKVWHQLQSSHLYVIQGYNFFSSIHDWGTFTHVSPSGYAPDIVVYWQGHWTRKRQRPELTLTDKACRIRSVYRLSSTRLCRTKMCKMNWTNCKY